MSLGELLAAKLLDWMNGAPDGVPRRVLLWLDPERQFVRLVDALGPELEGRGLTLLRSDPQAGEGQLRLKLALLEAERDDEARVVVYLPGYSREDLEPRADGGAPGLWSVYDYRFKGCVWGRGDGWQPVDLPEPPTLLGWLLSHGLTVADEKTAKKLVAGGSDSMLARYAVRMARRDPSSWPRPLRLSDVEEELGGDPRDVLRRLLAAPHNEVKRWGDERAVVLARLVGEYGFTLPETSSEKGAAAEMDAEPLVDSIVVQLALCEAWDAFGQPRDFPFLSRLPAKEVHRRRMAAFLRDDIAAHTELGPRFRSRMARLETGYDLADWAAGRDGWPVGLPLLARRQWKAFLHDFQQAVEGGWKSGLDYLLGRRAVIAARARTPWDGKGGESHWGTAEKLLDLGRRASEAVDEAEGTKSAGQLVARYRESWWRVDWLHLELCADCFAAGGLDQVRRLADLIYLHYAAEVNQRLAESVEREGVWPPAGVPYADTLAGTLWQSDKGRTGLIICDALRWDLGQKVLDALSGPDCSARVVASVLPSETLFGMAALMPVGGPIQVEYLVGETGKVRVKLRDQDGHDLSGREARREYLKAKLVDGDGKPIVEFAEVAALLKGAPVPESQVVVLFDNTIDEQGHKVPENLPVLARQLAGNLARTVELLHEAGVDTVHLVTDHGFLLLPPDEVLALGTPSAPVAQVVKREPRWAALLHDAPTQELIRLPSPFVPAPNELGLARGVRTLEKPEPYLHGGLSLQECVIPHLVSRSLFRPTKVGLTLEVTTPKLAVGTVPVVLRPVIPTGQASLGGVQPLRLRLWVETAEEGAGARRVADEQAIELRPDVEELKPAVYLLEGLALPAGQKLTLRAVDAESGRDLGSVPLTLMVDWD
ncbi:MAG: PglZ domain-containing protein [Sphingomonadaceae bacterium]